MNKNASAADPTPERDRSNVLPLKGEIDLHVSPSVTASLNSMIEKKPQRLVVDLSDVTYIDSAGLAALIGAMQKVEGYGGKFLLAGLQETVRSIFEISRPLKTADATARGPSKPRGFAQHSLKYRTVTHARCSPNELLPGVMDRTRTESRPANQPDCLRDRRLIRGYCLR